MDCGPRLDRCRQWAGGPRAGPAGEVDRAPPRPPWRATAGTRCARRADRDEPLLRARHGTRGWGRPGSRGIGHGPAPARGGRADGSPRVGQAVRRPELGMAPDAADPAGPPGAHRLAAVCLHRAGRAAQTGHHLHGERCGTLTRWGATGRRRRDLDLHDREGPRGSSAGARARSGRGAGPLARRLLLGRLQHLLLHPHQELRAHV